MSESLSFALILTLFKLASLGVGSAFGYMGYRLFLVTGTTSAGDFSATSKSVGIRLKNAAPGTFFSLFGATVICFSIWKGIEIHQVGNAAPQLSILIPDSPPK